MKPKFPEGLSHVKASYHSVYGEIKSEWTREKDAFSWDVTIPANTSAIVRIPKVFHIQKPTGAGIHGINETDTEIEIEIGSGSYRFVTQ
jgi:alpha-L-rhamnosidase